MKKIFLLALPIIALSNCDYYYQYTQCEPSKNYIIINKEAIKEYEQLVAKGVVQSHYRKIEGKKCGYLLQACLYEYKKGKFYETYLNEKEYKGVYTISISQDKTNPECKFKPYSPDKNCYLIEKNENNKIKSRYHTYTYTTKGVKKDVHHRKFIDKEKHIILIDSAYQIYSHPYTISGVYQAGFCPSKTTPSNSKINILSYPLF